MIDFTIIPGFLDLSESKKDSCGEFIKNILANEFPGENVDIKQIREYADGVEVTFSKEGEEYSFCDVSPLFFEKVL